MKSTRRTKARKAPTKKASALPDAASSTLRALSHALSSDLHGGEREAGDSDVASRVTCLVAAHFVFVFVFVFFFFFFFFFVALFFAFVVVAAGRAKFHGIVRRRCSCVSIHSERVGRARPATSS